MRRHDRDVTSPDQIDAILKACPVGRLGLADQGSVYIVPMHFTHRWAGGQLVIYFHGATAGRKIDLIGAGVAAGFEADRLLGHAPTDDPCNTTAHYESVIGSGFAELCRDPAEKRPALGDLIQRFTPQHGRGPVGLPMDAVEVIRLRLDHVTAKRNSPPA
jgi:nitroimidazol reductase NimA-like FMN-containing flavoprotein (pyridoxamine 5'-phosphate oxidase superfamily)